MEEFKRHIEAYINERITTDALFAEKYNASERSIDDCINYILNWVKVCGTQVIAKEEIYGQVVHFYDENLDPGKPIRANVICATRATLTEEDKKAAYMAALKQYQDAELAKMRERSQPRTKVAIENKTKVEAPSLFD